MRIIYLDRLKPMLMQNVKALWSECDWFCQTTSEGSLARIAFGSYVGVKIIRTTCRHPHAQSHHPTFTCDRYVIIPLCNKRRTELSHPQRPVS